MRSGDMFLRFIKSAERNAAKIMPQTMQMPYQ